MGHFGKQVNFALKVLRGKDNPGEDEPIVGEHVRGIKKKICEIRDERKCNKATRPDTC